MMFRQLRLLRQMYDHLKIFSDNGSTNRNVNSTLREYELSEFYREPHELNKGVTHAEPRNNA